MNEALNIERCLRSVAGWCQEIHVVDSGSTDQTVEVCKKFTDQVHFHPYVDHSSQLSWALQNLSFSSEWLLVLDADHAVSEGLKQDIDRVLTRPARNVDGYYLAHHYIFAGMPMHGFKPWSLRLVRHANVVVDASELVDARFVVKGPTRRLRGEIVESNEKERDIDFWIDKHQTYSSRAALEHVLRSSGLIGWSIQPKLIGTHHQRIAWLKDCWLHMPLFVRPMLYFLYRYVFGLGFLDGATGLLYHFLHAFWFRLLIDIKIAKIYERIRKGECSLAELAQQYTIPSVEADDALRKDGTVTGL